MPASNKPTTVIVGDNVWLDAAQTAPLKATIEVSSETGKILAVHKERRNQSAYKTVDWIDAGNAVVMPGIVDAHVHINEPGRTDWEGFTTATKAAAAGGATTVIDMPLNSIPPTTTVENLHVKRDAAIDQCWVNVGFYGGVIPNNQDQLLPLMAAGVRGFKCFLIESGVEEFPHVVESDLRLALEQLKKKDGLLLFHAEMTESCGSSEPATKKRKTSPKKSRSPSPSKKAATSSPVKTKETETDTCAYKTFLESRPKSLENRAIDLVIDLCREYRVRCHIVHLSSADALEAIRAAKDEGLPLTVETCFHYLFFNAEDIPSGATQFKCCPPIRSADNREALWQGLKDGTIDFVVSDHSPCTADLKKMDVGDFMSAWGGIASVQLGLPSFWTCARERDISIDQLIRLLCWNTAKQVGLDKTKGKIAAGFDADITVWDPDNTFTVDKEKMHFKNKVTPYHGKELYGVVMKTLVNGRIAFDAKSGHSAVAHGNRI